MFYLKLNQSNMAGNLTSKANSIKNQHMQRDQLLDTQPSLRLSSMPGSYNGSIYASHARNSMVSNFS